MKTNHKQAFFTTIDGECTLVDEGVAPLMEVLKRLGVKTQYSCQGGGPDKDGSDEDPSAYVMADYRSFAPVFRRALKSARKSGASKKAKNAADKFDKGHHQVQFSRYKKRRMLWAHNTTWGDKWRNNGYSFERTYSRMYGARLTIRWNASETDNVFALFNNILD